MDVVNIGRLFFSDIYSSLCEMLQDSNIWKRAIAITPSGPTLCLTTFNR